MYNRAKCYSILLSAIAIFGPTLNAAHADETYPADGQDQFSLQCTLTNGKKAEAFILEDAAGYSLTPPKTEEPELNLVTNQRGVHVYYYHHAIAGGELSWIRTRKGAYQYVIYRKLQHAETSGVVVTKNGSIIFDKACKTPMSIGLKEGGEIFSRVAEEDPDSGVIDLING